MRWIGVRWIAVLTLLSVCYVGTAAASVLAEAGIGDRVPMRIAANGLSKTLPATFTLERFDVYAPEARILQTQADGSLRELPRSAERFFLSSGEDGFSRFYVALQPDGRRVHGMKFEAGHAIEFSGVVDADEITLQSRKRVATAASDFQCATGDHHHAAPEHSLQRSPAAIASTSKGSVLHRATVAVDTDNELMSTKFANNTTAATSYLANLFAGMNVFYERDLDVRLVQGTTFLRSAADPYSQTSPFDQLNEVGGHWLNTPSLFAVDRAFVAFLSGKSPSTGSATGIAWLIDSGNYCAAKGTNQGAGQVAGHYSVVQVFKSSGSPASADVPLVGHELGHSFGAAHTHCTNMSGQQPRSTGTIDRCFSGESAEGCYAGATVCPTDNSVSGRGSIMSYCHLSGCGNLLQEFHPVHQGVLDARIATNIGNGCLTAIATPPADRVFADGFE